MLDQFYYEPLQLLSARAHRLAGRALEAGLAADSARYHLEQALVATPDDARMRAALAEAYALTDNPDSARREATLATALMPASRDAVITCVIHFNAAAALAVAGDTAAALDMLDQALAGGYRVSRTQAVLDPRFDSIRNEPRFRSVTGAQQ